MLVFLGRDWRGRGGVLAGGSEGHEASCAFGGDQITDGEAVTQIDSRPTTLITECARRFDVKLSTTCIKFIGIKLLYTGQPMYV
jgi:dihydroxyacetone kinase